MRGPSKIDEGNPCGFVCSIWTLTHVELTIPEARPIMRLLEGASSALRYTLDHPLDHVKGMGITTGSWCAILCALAFGKEEAGGGFKFSQTLVDDTIGVFASWLGTETFATLFPALPTFFVRPLVHLCISGELSRCRLVDLRC